MSQQQFRPPAALTAAVAVVAAIGFALTAAPVPAQMLSAAAVPALAKAPPSAAAPSALAKAPSAPAESHAVCKVLASQDRLDYPLTRVSRHLEGDRAIKIVAIG